MPATPSTIQSHGTARQYTLKGGRAVYMSNGCVVDRATNVTLAGSNVAADYLLERAKLTDDEREWLDCWGRAAFKSAGATPMSRNEIARMKA